MRTSLKKIVLVLSLATLQMIIALPARSQQGVAINHSGAPADSSAILDVSSTAKGMLIPRMTEPQRNAIVNPAEGLIIYNTTTQCLEIYIPNQWQAIYCGCGSMPSPPGAISGNTDICAGQSYIYSIAAVPGATSYNWTLPSGSSVSSGQGTVSVMMTAGSNSGNISVTAVSNCGSSSPSTLAVTAFPSLSAPGAISGPSSVSTGQSGITYSISSVSGATTYTWTVPSGAAIASGQGTTSITVNFGSASGDICVTAGNQACSSIATCLYVTVGSCPPGSQVFSFTGGVQTFTVPSCVTSITVTALGAQGGGPNGGNGGRAIATIPVTPNEVLNVYVGGQPTVQLGPGGYNGGGAVGALPCSPANNGWPGGGASDVRRGSTLPDRLIVAAGGGGGGWSNGIGGAGGGLNGGDGADSWIVGTNGKGGTQSSGGAGGYYSGNGEFALDGTLGLGGDARPLSGYCIGGGGGGGYYGGGGGYVSAAGGGSSFVSYPGNTNTSTTAGVQTGNGQVTIAW